MEDNYDVSKLIKGKKKKINSNSKGNRFERNIVDFLNERFKTTEFCRTPGSGAFATSHNLPEYMKIYGDLITPKNFKYCLELKSGYNKESVESLFNPKSQLRQFIVQAERDAEKSKKEFILILKQNNKEPVCLMNKTLQLEIELKMQCILWQKYMLVQLKDLFSLSDWFFLGYT